MGRKLERRLTAYLDGADRDDQPENIHTDAVAREMGYRGGLVYGTTVYAWATPLILEALGEDWLRDGWADLQVRRPLYAGDDLTIRLEEADGGAFELSAVCEDGRPRLLGTVGRGRGPWLADHVRSQRLEVEPHPDPRPRITLDLLLEARTCHVCRQSRSTATPACSTPPRPTSAAPSRTAAGR